MQETIDCPVCTGHSFSPLFTKQAESFVSCDGCGLMLINPRPEMQQVEQTYDSDYSDHYIKKAEKKLKRCRQWVARVKSRYQQSAVGLMSGALPFCCCGSQAGGI